MIEIETYIKKTKIITSLENINEEYSKYFVKCNDENCLQYIVDFDYIEGAIIISCSGIQLLDFSHWDLVDQLWFYLIDAVYKIVKGDKIVKFFFPDQPMIFKIQVISDYWLLLNVKDKSITVNKQEFITLLLSKAEHFFSIFVKCNYCYTSIQSNNALAKIKAIKEYKNMF